MEFSRYGSDNNEKETIGADMFKIELDKGYVSSVKYITNKKFRRKLVGH